MRFALGLVRQTIAGLTVLLALTVVLGVLYPAAVWGISRLDRDSAEGSPLRDRTGCVVGSTLIGVDPQVEIGAPDPYFHTRVVGSVADGDPFTPGDPAAATPTNQGPNSEVLARFVDARRAAIAARDGVAPGAVPVDAVTGSGSAVDPHISPAYAAIQIDRVARVNGMSPTAVADLVDRYTSGRTLGFLGAPRVDVGALNVALGLTAPSCGSGG